MFDASRLWADAGLVVALRSWRIMGGGPAAYREAEHMLSEKVEAGFELAGALAGGRVTSPEAAARKGRCAPTAIAWSKARRRNRRRPVTRAAAHRSAVTILAVARIAAAAAFGGVAGVIRTRCFELVHVSSPCVARR